MRVPTHRDVRRATVRIHKHLDPTPVLRSGRLNAHLKLENLQVTGAYKVRGALNALSIQVERGDHRPVVAASAGNHSAGMAWAADRLGLSCTAVVPSSAPRAKIEATRALGAEVIIHGDRFEDAARLAEELGTQRGYRLLHPFDDPDVIAGQGSVAMELLEYRPDVVIVPIGGGGLASGVALALRRFGVRVVGVQVEGVDSMRRTLAGLRPFTEPAITIADGVRVKSPGLVTRRVCGRLLDRVITVTEAQVKAAMISLFREEGLVTEGAGALATAALPQVSGERKLAVVTGGNVDPKTLRDLLTNTTRSSTIPHLQRLHENRISSVSGGRLASIAT